MSTRQTIKDFTVLGRASPETLSDGRQTVCVGGWSDGRGYVRLYPTRMDLDALRRWNVVSVPVVHDPSHDNRNESYKIEGSSDEWDIMPNKIEQVGRWDKQQRREFVENQPKQCTGELNKLRQSLGIVKPKEIVDTTIKPPKDPDAAQNSRRVLTKNNRKRLYIKYACECECHIAGDYHEQHCIEWGMYEFWRKHGDKYPDDEVVNTLRLHDEDYDVYFLVGNLANHRTAYIIISVLRFKRDKNGT